MCVSETNQPDLNDAGTRVVRLLADGGFAGMAEAIGALLREARNLQKTGVGDEQSLAGRSRFRAGSGPLRSSVASLPAGPLATSVGGCNTGLLVTGDGAREREESVFDYGGRSERALKLAVAEACFRGQATRKTVALAGKLCGHPIDRTQMLRAAERLDRELDVWRRRPLGRMVYLVLGDQREKLRGNGGVVDCDVLTAIGIAPDGRRTVLGVGVSPDTAPSRWRTFLDSLLGRGLQKPSMVLAGNPPAVGPAIDVLWPSVPVQSCQLHLEAEVARCVAGKSLRNLVVTELRAVFDSAERTEADRQLACMVNKYQSSDRRLATWLQSHVPAGLTVLSIPPGHRRRMRRATLLRLLRRELRSHTRLVVPFPSLASIETLATSVLADVSDNWETGKTYLKMEPYEGGVLDPRAAQAECPAGRGAGPDMATDE